MSLPQTIAPQEIKALTSLRFIAALYVFLFHIHIRWPLSTQPFLDKLLSQGAVGMSIFFMLSGYILAYRYNKDHIDLREYAINRFAKIYPVYFVAALITIPWIGITFSGADPLQTTIKLGTLITANITMLQAWFHPMFKLWNNGASWSISVEFFLYVMFPAIAYLIRHKSAKQLLYIIAALYVASLLPGLVHVAYPTETRYFYSLPIFRLSEFTLGMLAFYITAHVKINTKILDTAISLALVITIAYLGFFGKSLPGYTSHNWIIIPTIFIALIALANNQTYAARSISNGAFVWMGKISYCFYSFQAFLLLPMIQNKIKIKEHMPIFDNHIILAATAFVVLTLLSWAGYTLIEEPMRKKIRNKFNQRKTDAQCL